MLRYAGSQARPIRDRENRMPTVETALGPVATTELGPTLMHEHVVTRSPGVQENWPHLCKGGIMTEPVTLKVFSDYV
jgi:hypothetical protein